MSSICLIYFENPLDDPGYGPNDPRWIGAWWMGFVLEGLLLLMAAVPISMFPKTPGVRKSVHRPEKDIRFSFSGVPGVGAVMIAITLGGYLIWKFRPTMKFLLGAMIVSEVVGASGFLILMIPKCEKLEMANFGMDNEGLILEGSCNMNCNCSRKSFTPVCGSDLKTIYFSQCYAGCEQHSNKTFFNNCSCISDSANANETIENYATATMENYATATMENYATEGFCMTDSCWRQALVYIIAWPTIQFLVSILKVMQKLMLLRCTLHQDKSLAIAFFEGVTCTLGFVPYFIVFGGMVDTACLVWESSCEETGNCWFYDTDKFSNILHGSSALFSFLSVGTMGIIYCMRGRFNHLYEDDFFYEEVEMKPAVEK